MYNLYDAKKIPIIFITVISVRVNLCSPRLISVDSCLTLFHSVETKTRMILKPRYLIIKA